MEVLEEDVNHLLLHCSFVSESVAVLFAIFEFSRILPWLDWVFEIFVAAFVYLVM